MDNQNLDRLKSLLTEGQQWPQQYMFKFIVPNSENRVDRVVELLPRNGRTTFNHTKNLKHVSVTCVAMMESADLIVEITQKVMEVPGVITL